MDIDLPVHADAGDTGDVIAKLDALHTAAQRAIGSSGTATEKERSPERYVGSARATGCELLGPDRRGALCEHRDEMLNRRR